MNVNKTGADYPAAGYEIRRTERNVTERKFAEHAAQAAGAASAFTLHGADQESGDTVLSSWTDVVSGAEELHGVEEVSGDFGAVSLDSGKILNTLFHKMNIIIIPVFSIYSVILSVKI